MKKDQDFHGKVEANSKNEMETIKKISSKENGQPVPQPKDYDEIEY
ncbi:hypothetical protein [Falsibacillus albus]|nr:hypothetical protein [Falsibacillus albus]